MNSMIIQNGEETSTVFDFISLNFVSIYYIKVPPSGTMQKNLQFLDFCAYHWVTFNHIIASVLFLSFCERHDRQKFNGGHGP